MSQLHNYILIYEYSVINLITPIVSPVAPKIDRRNVRDLTVREGEPIMFDIKVKGEPAPDVNWVKDGRPIKQTAQNRVDNEPYR